MAERFVSKLFSCVWIFVEKNMKRSHLYLLFQPKQIEYSQKYMDATYEYRHVVLTEDASKLIPKNRMDLLSSGEWRTIGVQQSNGWEHYTWHRPERHILLFRRPLGTVISFITNIDYQNSFLTLQSYSSGPSDRTSRSGCGSRSQGRIRARCGEYAPSGGIRYVKGDDSNDGAK